jgi:DNA-directed RNA polymerase specialized sigma24 family protein
MVSDHQTGCSKLPPFWLAAEVDETETIDPIVVTVAEQSWPWAYRMARHELRDEASALEIVEATAIEVSRRLRMQPEVGVHLAAYYRAALTHRIRAIALRNGRIQYRGSTQDLEAHCRLTTPQGFKRVEASMVLESILLHTTANVGRMLHYRLLDYSWREIATEFAITEKQVRSRFYYGIHTAHRRLVLTQESRLRFGDPLNWHE